MKHGKRMMNRIAAAYALNIMRGKGAISALEKAVGNRKEHPKVRGQAAEALANGHRRKSHRVLLQNLSDPSEDVRFWCAFSLAEIGDGEAIPRLRELVEKDHRVVRGFWSVSREAKWAIRQIQSQMRHKSARRSKRCLFCL
jgi:HEAT repeat protein